MFLALNILSLKVLSQHPSGHVALVIETQQRKLDTKQKCSQCLLITAKATKLNDCHVCQKTELRKTCHWSTNQYSILYKTIVVTPMITGKTIQNSFSPVLITLMETVNDTVSTYYTSGQDPGIKGWCLLLFVRLTHSPWAATLCLTTVISHFTIWENSISLHLLSPFICSFIHQ